MTLFDEDFSQLHAGESRRRMAERRSSQHDPAEQVVRVLPDVPAMDRALDYSVPPELRDRISLGCVVRIPLQGRRVRGWVLEVGVRADPRLTLATVAKVTGLALDAEVIELARWIAWRWVGRLPSVLRLATPDRAVGAPLRRRARSADPTMVPEGATAGFAQAEELLQRGQGTQVGVVSPLTDPAGVALAAASRGQALVVVPALDDAARISTVLSAAGATVTRWPGGTAASLAGHTVVGGHTAVLAPMPALRAVVVIDEHDPRLQNASSPTWHAREVAVERARRAGVPCLLVSPMPSLEALQGLPVGTSPRGLSVSERRAGWARTEVLDRRDSDPREGLFSPRFTAAARATLGEGRAVVCVLNRTGRARLLSCRSCGLIAGCEVCGAAVRTVHDEHLECVRCGTSRPRVCLACGSHGMKVLRMGVSRAREDLAALLREQVGLIAGGESDLGGERVVIGTEAVLNRRADSLGARVGLVALLDFDQDLMAARYRASEDALGAIVKASRLVGGRGGTVLVQTRNPGHPVLGAAVAGDALRLSSGERERRQLLGLPPAASIAAVGGEAAGEWIRRLGRPSGLRVQGPNEGWWLLRAADPRTLADAAGAVDRPPGRLRLRVDPMALPGL